MKNQEIYQEELYNYQFGNIDKALQWIFLLLIGLLPLIIRAKVIEFAAPDFISSIANTGLKADVFNYYKWVFLAVLSAITLVLFLIKLTKGYKIKKSNINVPLLIFASLILFSGLFAEYKSIAMKGMYNRYEGTMTYLYYLTIFFVAANTKYDKNFLNRISLALGIVVVVNGLLGISHFFGLNEVSNTIAKTVVLPTDMANAGSGEIWSTFSHPNYLSGFAAIATAYFLYLSGMSETNIDKLKYGLLTVLSFSLIISSLSSSGILTFIVVLPVILLLTAYLSREKVKSMLVIGSVLGSCLMVLILMNNFNNQVSDEIINIFKGIPLSAATIKNAEASEQAIEEITLEEFNLPQPGWSSGTGRTYIWGKTIDLIMEKPFLGHGLDTLTYYFPQNDKYKVSNIWRYVTLVDKPHNIYLGIAFGSGVVGLMALLTIILSYLLKTLSSIKEKSCDIIYTPAIFLAIVAFLVQGLFNDSIIGLSIIFWLLMGVGISIFNNNKGNSIA